MNFNFHGWVYEKVRPAALNVDITPVSPVKKGKN